MADAQDQTKDQNKEQVEQTKGGDHIQTTKEEEAEDKGTGGFLSPLGDPLGKALHTGLSPLGAGVNILTKPLQSTVGGITKPILGPVAGAQEERAEVLGGENKDSYVHGKDSLGGKVQDGENPLGLDETGKFGFREEKEG